MNALPKSIVLVHYPPHQPLFLYPAIAKRLNLTDGQTLESEAQYWQVLTENAAHFQLMMQYEYAENAN